MNESTVACKVVLLPITQIDQGIKEQKRIHITYLDYRLHTREIICMVALCTTLWVSDCVVHHRPALCTTNLRCAPYRHYMRPHVSQCVSSFYCAWTSSLVNFASNQGALAVSIMQRSIMLLILYIFEMYSALCRVITLFWKCYESLCYSRYINVPIASSSLSRRTRGSYGGIHVL